MPNWTTAYNEIKAFKQYVAGLSADAQSKIGSSVVIRTSDLQNLVTQRGAGQPALDAVRIYLGLKTEAGQTVLTAYAVADQLVAAPDDYTDYNMPANQAAFDAANAAGTLPALVSGAPCPPKCTVTNALTT
ncbi:MAG TPA: hypothetical protein PL045_04100 [Chitinophagaceae bacterium]|nr:hypothetical protein [Chitinophagaceae bacterium]